MRKLGQHFLNNPAVVKKIIAAVDPQASDVIMEIGPGHGELTATLAEVCRERGASLTVIEKDIRLAEALDKRSAELGIKIVSGDAVTLLPAIIEEMTKEGKGTIKLCGNLPYYITGKLLRLVSELPETPMRCVFMVQREVAERIAAQPPQMNRLAASVQVWADPKIVTAVPRHDFTPPPDVESAVILLTKKNSAPKGRYAEKERYYKAVRALFSQPRKTVANNIAQSIPTAAKAEVSRTLENLHIDPHLRPQDLSIKDIHTLAAAFF